jgi:hypothetical protein
MTKLQPPLSRNDAREKFCLTLTIHIPKDSPLHQFLEEEHWDDTETKEDTVLRLLQERLSLSSQGF